MSILMKKPELKLADFLYLCKVERRWDGEE